MFHCYNQLLMHRSIFIHFVLRCVLALKRNDDDLKRASQFLRHQVSGNCTEGTSKTTNGISPQPVLDGKFSSNLDTRTPQLTPTFTAPTSIITCGSILSTLKVLVKRNFVKHFVDCVYSIDHFRCL